MKKQAASDAKKKGSTVKTTTTARPKRTRRINDEERIEMIRVAAYHIAAKRGFGPGSELDDWLMAEQTIAQTFPSP